MSTRPDIGARLAIKAIRLLRKNKADEATAILKNLTHKNVADAEQILSNQAIVARKITEIGKRHGAKTKDTIETILQKAVEAGDADAELLIAAGLLDYVVF
jgi:hypothetical protein